MKKIPTLFIRDSLNPKLVTGLVTPGCEWVLSGDGVATRKWDGTACAVIAGKLYKRWDGGRGDAPIPEGFIPAEPNSAHKVGWLPVTDRPEDRWHAEAVRRSDPLPDGTYELCGPKINRNPDGFEDHILVPHGVARVEWGPIPPVPPADVHAWLALRLSDTHIEGIVWHHPDGRMAKIKRRDFGFPWPVKK